MTFRDEYEYVTGDQTFYVEVEGVKYLEDGVSHTELTHLIISDHTGQIDDEHEHFAEVFQDAHEREYELELHSTGSLFGSYGA